MTVAGIVLAGGMSRRFGSPKAFARMASKYFYEIAFDALDPHCDEVVIVSRPELLDRHAAGEKVISDLPEFAGLGPLAGILSAMESVEADRYIVLPCDMPYINAEVIRRLLMSHEKDVTSVISDGRHHPLVSVWDRDMKDMLRKMLESGQLRVMTLLNEVEMTWIPGNVLTENEGLVFTNVNTPDVLERG